MNTVLLANIVSFIGALMMVGIGLLKKKHQILLVQSVQFMIQAGANLMLGGVTGAVSNGVSVLRNVFCLRWEYTTRWKIVFLAVQIIFSAGVNTMGLLGWLPVISMIIYTWFLDLKSEIQLKIVMIVAQLMWVVYDFTLMNYVSFTFDILTIISNLLGIRLILKERKQESEV